MRSVTSLVAALSAGIALSALGQQAGGSADKAPETHAATMAELMVHLVHPASDAVFYVSSRTPETDAEWRELQRNALTVAESANLLLMPGRTRAGRWDVDARQMLAAGRAAFEAAKAKDVAGVEAVSDALYESCVGCHAAYRPQQGDPPPR